MPRRAVIGRESCAEDRWGEVVDRSDVGYVELRWYDTTEVMTGDEFRAWLTCFAEQVERLGRPAVLVDSTRFRMDPACMDGPWRDANIIPPRQHGWGAAVLVPHAGGDAGDWRAATKRTPGGVSHRLLRTSARRPRLAHRRRLIQSEMSPVSAAVRTHAGSDYQRCIEGEHDRQRGRALRTRAMSAVVLRRGGARCRVAAWWRVVVAGP